MSFHFYQDITTPPARGLTHEEVRTAAADLCQRADTTAEVLRRFHKLGLILVNFCRSTHSPKG